MFKIKKSTKAGQCAAMRCQAPASDLLCAKHETEWKESGQPPLTNSEALPAEEKTALEKTKAELGTERGALQKVLERCQSLPVQTREQLEALGVFSGKVQAKLQELETRRRSIVDPYNATVKEVNAWFKPLTDLCTSILKTNKERIGTRVLELQAEQDAAMKKIEDGAGTAPAETFEIAHRPVETSSNISVRTEWMYTVEDAALIPEMYWTRVLNTNMLDQEVKTSKDACKIPGIRVFKTASTTVRKA